MKTSLKKLSRLKKNQKILQNKKRNQDFNERTRHFYESLMEKEETLDRREKETLRRLNLINKSTWLEL